MERISVNLDSLKSIPGYKVILKTVLQSQIQQLVEQLSQHTEDEVVCLTASLGDGTISHIGSGIGKEFLQENDDIKSHFLAFCLKRQHQMSVSQQPRQTTSQKVDQKPIKVSGSFATVRHKPYSLTHLGRRSRKITMANRTNRTETSKSDRNILEKLSIQLADVNKDDVDSTEDFNVTDNEGVSDTDKDKVQKLKELNSLWIQDELQSKGSANISKENTQDTNPNLTPNKVNSEAKSSKTVIDNSDFILDPNIEVKKEVVTEAEFEVKSENIDADVDLPNHRFSEADGTNADLQKNSSGLTQEQSDIGHEDWSPMNKYSKEIRYRKRKGEIPVYANITPTQTKCPYCAQNYANNANLKRHIRKHEGIYPYQCDACQRKFTDPTMFKRHVTNTKKACWSYYNSHSNMPDVVNENLSNDFNTTIL